MENPKQSLPEIESIIRQIHEEIDDIAETFVAHPAGPTRPDYLIIEVHTGEANQLVEWLDDVNGHKRAAVGEETTAEIQVGLTLEGPGHIQGYGGTTVYKSEAGSGAESRTLEEGLVRLKKKVNGVCPDCGESVGTTFDEHYSESSECPANHTM